MKTFWYGIPGRKLLIGQKDLLDPIFVIAKILSSTFSEWLKNKYGTLENLNMNWGANFGEWNQVGPHRQSPIGMPVDKDFRNLWKTNT